MHQVLRILFFIFYDCSHAFEIIFQSIFVHFLGDAFKNIVITIMFHLFFFYKVLMKLSHHQRSSF